MQFNQTNKNKGDVNNSIVGQSAPRTRTSVDLTPQQKLVQICKDLDASLIGRTAEIGLVATTIVANTSMLIVSPPGCAKSFLVENFFAGITGGNKPFVYQMGKYTEPKHLFGGPDILAMKAGQFRINTKGMLPEAPAVFLDEIWKSSTAAANLLLRVTQERVFNDGTGEKKIPCRAWFFASNEWWQDGELMAIADRCVIRIKIDYVTKRSERERLMDLMDHTPKISVTMTLDELDQCHREAMALVIPPEVVKLRNEIVQACIDLGVRPSDRRLPLLGKILRAYAYVQGAKEVTTDHLEVLAHVLWTDPLPELIKKVAQIIAKIANPSGMLITDLLQQAEDVVAGETKPMETITKMKDLSIKLASLPESLARDKAVAMVWEMEKQAGYRHAGLVKRDVLSSLPGR
jgi:MoxR-like ATPase